MLNGELVSLREMEARDLDQVFLWDEQDEVYLFRGRYKFATKEDLKNNFIGYSFSQKIFVMKNDQSLIGLASYWAIDHRNKTCEFYAKIYDKDIDPQPYLTESLDILIKFLFNHENLSRIYTLISDPSDPIKPVLKKMGFLKEGTLREHRFIKGQYVDTDVYGQLAGEKKLANIEPIQRRDV
ncbi:MAG: GNAT family protein [Desulfobacula sp.]|jgi:RimJ/RimL family protein N-acetyltransferase